MNGIYQKMNNLPNLKYIFDRKEVVPLIKQSLVMNRQLLITSINVNVLHKINRHSSFRNIYYKFDKIRFDGYYSIVWAKSIGFKNRIQQISADILMKEIFNHTRKNSWKICVLGGSPKTEQQFSKRVCDIYPDVDISYHHHGYFATKEQEEIIKELNCHSPDILIVGLSVPKEHEWCINNRSKLNAKIILTCGGYIEQTSIYGINYYPHDWIYKYHLNWIYRILKEPARLWGRYLTQGLWFITWLPWQFIKAGVFKNKFQV